MSDLNLEDKLCKNLEDSCTKAYKLGQQSMQAKIDDIQSKLSNMEFFYNQKKNECAGLQGRIEKALVACHESGVLGVFLAIKVEDALRGDSK